VTRREGFQRLRLHAGTWFHRHWPMLFVTIGVWWLAVLHHHHGISWGDDFALYLRQARSVFDGNMGQVVSDNRFNVLNAAKPGFSPIAYPWGWPLLLSPFVRMWGLDYDRLKWLEVACLCGFLWVFHSLLQRRCSRWMALGVVAAVGTTTAYLAHTDFLLSEYPYMFAAAFTLWWLDRCRRNGALDLANRRQLVTLGLLAVAVFNIRREGLAIIIAIAATQALDLRGRWSTADLRHAATPLVTFVVGVVGFQLLAPSALAPQYADAGLHQTWHKLGAPFRGAFATQLGLPELRRTWLLLVFALVIAGLVIRLWQAPRLDVPLAVFAIGSLTMVGTIPALADRYLLAITPFALYFVAQALAALPLPRRSGRWLAVAMLGALVVVHAVRLGDTIDHVQRSRRNGAVVDGPEAPYARAAFAAVREHTHMDDVVAFFKVRALTLYTDRRGVQSSELDIIRQRADYFLMRRESSAGQPDVSTEQGSTMGWTVAWQDTDWVLWKLDPPND
jgi:hypothetical protein